MLYSRKRIPIREELILGNDYVVFWSNYHGCTPIRTVKFIKVTAKGYNFLDLKTNTCVLKNHLYKNKDGIFFKNLLFQIEPIKENQTLN